MGTKRTTPSLNKMSTPEGTSEITDKVWRLMSDDEQMECTKILIEAFCAEDTADGDRLFGKLVEFEEKMLNKYL